MQKRTQLNVIYLIVALGALISIQSLLVQIRTVEPISYSEFQTYLKDNAIGYRTDIRQSDIRADVS